MVRKWAKSWPIEMVCRKTAFLGDTTVYQQKLGGTVRKEGPCPIRFNPEGGGSVILKNADI
jgi:hypothetical protein